MIPQYDFDRLYDSASTDQDRNVMNQGEMPDDTGFVMSMGNGPKTKQRIGRYDRVEFTDGSADYMTPLEDEDLLSGRVTPSVAGYYDTASEYDPKVYDPMNDTVIGEFTDPSVLTPGDIGKIPKDAFGHPDFFKDPVTLTIASAVLAAVIVLEIIVLFALF